MSDLSSRGTLAWWFMSQWDPARYAADAARLEATESIVKLRADLAKVRESISTELDRIERATAQAKAIKDSRRTRATANTVDGDKIVSLLETVKMSELLVAQWRPIQRDITERLTKLQTVHAQSSLEPVIRSVADELQKEDKEKVYAKFGKEMSKTRREMEKSKNFPSAVDKVIDVAKFGQRTAPSSSAQRLLDEFYEEDDVVVEPDVPIAELAPIREATRTMGLLG